MLLLSRTSYDVPACFFHREKTIFNTNLNNKLFINAWDPWSALGNGNSSDNSADGFWGRSTAISLIGWPLSNPKIRYVSTGGPSPLPPMTSTSIAQKGVVAFLVVAIFLLFLHKYSNKRVTKIDNRKSVKRLKKK